MIPIDMPWSIRPLTLEAICSASKHAIIDGDISALHQLDEPRAIEGGIVLIDIIGVMMQRPSMFDRVVFSAVDTDEIRRAVESATADSAVRTILLRIDTPGGSVQGLAELADAVFEARKTKRVIAQVNGMAASAGFLVASQATEIFMGRMDIVGSIGTVMMLYDFSEAFAEAGIKAVPINTGEFKSAGAMGTVITDAQRADFQRLIDSFFADFKASVRRGRGMGAKQLDDIADGRVFIGKEAVELGLVDKIQAFDVTIGKITKSSRDRRRVRSEQESKISSIMDLARPKNRV